MMMMMRLLVLLLVSRTLLFTYCYCCCELAAAFVLPTKTRYRQNSLADRQWAKNSYDYGGVFSLPQQQQWSTTTTTTLFSVNNNPIQHTIYSVTVSYQGQSCNIQVASNETILTALERHKVADVLSLPAEMPSDCRRGNCLTCAAKWKMTAQPTSSSTTCSSSSSNVKQERQNPAAATILRGEDGLSPTVSDKVAELGYMLTCSSYVQGDGLELSLGENHVLWDLIYRQRLESEETQIAARKAMARVIRKSDERNVPRWKRETEEALRKSGGDQLDIN